MYNIQGMIKWVIKNFENGNILTVLFIFCFITLYLDVGTSLNKLQNAKLKKY